MKIKLTLRRAGVAPVDLMTTVDAVTTVGDLAGALRRRDPRGTEPVGAAMTLELIGDALRAPLDPEQLVADSPLTSGATVALAPVSVGADASRAAAAVVRVVEGPDAGREFSLARGSNVIGRTSSCEVRVSDTSVSREHAKLNISDVVEVVDLGSSNGIAVGDSPVSRVVLRPRDHVRLGDTVLTVELLEASAATVAAGPHVPFNRSPRLEPTYSPPTFALPEPPARPQQQRFPVIALIAPLIFGALLYAITRSPTSLIFVALSPVMAVGSVAESRFSGRRAHAAAVAAWRGELAELAREAQAEMLNERAARVFEDPATVDVLDAVGSRNPLLWSRTPDHARFLQMRLGLGTLTSRIPIDLPGSRQSEKALWRELEEFRDRFAVVTDVPVVANLKDGPVGVAGERQSVTSVVRALLQQIVGLHSPAEVVLTAALASDACGDWEWLGWLPHVTSSHSPLSVRHLAAAPGEVASLLAALEELVETRRDQQSDDGPAVIFMVDDLAAVERARLVALAQRGARCGVHVLWLGASVERLPACCLTFVDTGNGQVEPTAGFVLSGQSVTPLSLERLDATAVLDMGRRLSPLVDSGVPIDDDSDLPRAVSWLALHDPALIEQAGAVVERWQESSSLMTGPYAPAPHVRRPGSLRAVLGESADGPHVLDLRTHGPHALVGGTTGSGKSELLQSWILGLASTHSPQRVTFLLVDYKGGSAFRECLDLPHTVGLVTDLSPHLVRRALTSLKAELRYREELLGRKKKKDLQSLEETGDPETPPSLVIVVDEFAALVQEVPEFVDGVVDVAQRGRSLGLHLILATQRPAGVIRDNLRANTNLRIALRVADEGDSTDVIGTPQAAAFDPAVPGRAVSKTGPGRLISFQSAYAGGWTTEARKPPEILVEELSLRSRRSWAEPDRDDAPTPISGPTDINRVVATIRTASSLAAVPEPRKPWQPELLDTYDLIDLERSHRDDELVFGILDDPEHQSQPVIAFHPDRDGNLAVYGTGGSGKSGLLRALAVSAGFTTLGGPCQVYGIDFGARGLDMLEQLPHVGSIMAGGDHERIVRLLGELRQLVDERASRYAKAKAGSITEYRALTGRMDEARILLLVDSVGAFRSAYEGSDRVRWFDAFQSLAADGRPVGLHVVISADRPAAVPSALGSSVQSRVILRLAEESDYATLGEPVDVLAVGSPPGRGVAGGRELQVAILGGTRNTLEQAQAIAELAVSMRAAAVPEARAIARLSDNIELSSLPSLVAGLPVLGVGAADLAPVGFEPTGPFVVTGPPGSGRTTAIITLLSAIRRCTDLTEVHYFGDIRSAIAQLPDLTSISTDVVEAAAAAARLTSLLSSGSLIGPVIVVIENMGEFVNTPADLPLQTLSKAVLAGDHFLIVEGETTTLMGMSPLLTLAKSRRSGLALQPESAEATVFRTEFPRLRRADLPPGRAVLVQAGRPTLLHLARVAPAAIGTGSSPHSLAAR